MRIAAGTIITARTLLFDMDGTLVDSTAAVERIWGGWARNNGLDLAQFVHRMHGRRAIDTMREIAPPGVDPEQAVAQIDEAELIETEGIVPIKGATDLIASLPAGSWALVTSARPALAQARMAAAGLPMPDIVVTSADVSQGKPHPACYLQALQRMDCPAELALVFEDAPAGFAAGRGAGCRTIALATTSTPEQLDHEDWLPDLRSITLDDVMTDGRLQLVVR